MYRLLIALLLLAPAIGMAQVYRCGNAYSAQSCTGGKVIDARGSVIGGEGQRTHVYLCESYDSRKFWSSQVCSQQNALMERMESVPASASWDDQVRIAMRQRDAAATMVESQNTPTPAQMRSGMRAAQAQCASLAEEVMEIDNRARRAQSPQMQDWLKQRRVELRSMQFATGCG